MVFKIYVVCGFVVVVVVFVVVCVVVISVLLLLATEQEDKRTVTLNTIQIKICRKPFVKLIKITFILVLHLYRSNIRINQPYNNVKRFVPKQVQKGDIVMNVEIKKRVGKNIKMLRERAGLSQEEVAARLQVGGCDITRSAVAKIEVGQRHLYPDEIMLLKDILNAKYEEIFDVK